MIMKKLEESILQWHRETFKNATAYAVISKLKEELNEALLEIACGDHQHLLEECADIFIVACSLAARSDLFEDNVSMCRVISDKMEVNKMRIWGEELPNGDRKRVK